MGTLTRTFFAALAGAAAGNTVRKSMAARDTELDLVVDAPLISTLLATLAALLFRRARPVMAFLVAAGITAAMGEELDRKIVAMARERAAGPTPPAS